MSEQKNLWESALTGFRDGLLNPLGFASNLSGALSQQSGSGTAQQQLEQFQSTRPESYSSPYQSQISSLTGQLSDRNFSYDYTQDPVYQQYRRSYEQKAQRAGENAQANAAVLGGGYGSSWAATAGANAYDYQMSGLDEVINRLYSQALSEYNDETDTMRSNLNSLLSAESNAQNAYQNQLSNWYDQLNYYQNQYESAAQREQSQANTWWTIGGNLLSAAISLLPYALALL